MTIALRGLHGRLLILTATAAGLLGAPLTAHAASVTRGLDDENRPAIIISETNAAGEVNDIRVTADASYVYVTDEGNTNVTAGAGCQYTGINPLTQTKTVRCSRTGGDPESIEVNLGNLADAVYLNHPTLNFIDQSEINGGAGVDLLNGLLVGADTINGGSEGDNLFGYGGNDNLRGDGGSDSLYGGDGNDNLRGGAGDSDDFNGGNGTDTVDYSNDGSNGVGAEINGNANSGAGCHGVTGPSCEGDVIRQDVENLTGSSGNDVLRGNDEVNVLTGLAGNDRLFGFGGNDTLNGGDGDDRLQGGLGNDTIRGGDASTDTSVQDWVDYSDRETTAGETDDVDVNLQAGTGGMPATGSTAAETDTITGVENAQTGGGDDTLIGTDHDTNGNELRGGAGDDFFRGLDGDDDFYGEAGTDTVSYEDDANDDSRVVVTIDDVRNDGSAEDDGSADRVNTDVENVWGGPDDDELTGSTVNNILDGRAGNDTLRGLAGGDTLIGGEGTGDIVSYSDRTDGVVADIDGQIGDDGNALDGVDGQRDTIDTTVEHLTGGSGGDRLIGSSANNTLSGADGDDYLRGGAGADVFNGGNGDDIVDYDGDARTTGVVVTIGNNFADDGASAPSAEGDNVQADVENIVGTQFGDNITGDADANRLFGLGGSDTLNGLGGNDLVDGGAGAGDIINGGSENDVLHGGTSISSGSDGQDFIDGGTGNDTVTYASSLSQIQNAAVVERFAPWASLERTGNVNVTLDNVANDGAAGETDSVNLIENITGGAGNDTLVGHTGAAGSAANVLDGRAGDDTLRPGAEGAIPFSDTLIGGPGERDRADYSDRGTDKLVITLNGVADDGEVDASGNAIENDDIRSTVEDVTTAGGDDTVTGDPQNDNIIKTNAGNDTVFVRDSNADDVDCGTGTDTLTADRRDTYVGCETANLPPQPLISVSGPQNPVTEGSSATFTISIDDTTAQTVTVSYTTSNGTATAGQDYTQTNGVAQIPAGQTQVQIPVPTTDDTLDEDSETFNFTISSPSNATMAPGGNTATATIADNDAAPTVSVGNASVDEGDSGTKTVDVPISLSAPSSKDVTVKFTTGGGNATPGGDYTPVAERTVTIPAGQTTVNTTVEIIGDTVDEANETFDVTLSEPTNATIGDGTGTVTITDDDSAPVVSIADASENEGDAGTKNMSFTATLSKASEKTVTVNYATSNGTATAGSDYTTSAGTLTFEPGTTTATANVPINGDTTPEADETFTVTLSNAQEATIADDATATGTILDDDQPDVAVSDAMVTEGDTNATFTVTLSEASGRTVTVDYTTSDGSAVAPADYTDTSGTLTFAPGETSKQVDVPVKEDSIDEPDETFTLNLSAPEGAGIGDGTGTGTITDDDATPTLSVADAAVTEGDAGTRNLTFTVTQSAASGREVTVKYATSNGTAAAGSDYSASNGTLTFAPGETSKQVNVTVAGDAVDEADETLALTLSEPTDATVADGTATGTITDDDGTPSLSVGDATIAEGDTGTKDLTFPVTLSGASGSDVTIKFATSDGTATAGSDYTATNGTLTIPAGQTSGEIKVSITGDAADEADETFSVTLTEPAGATIGDGTATGTIADDDQAVVQPPAVPGISVGDVRVNEGDSGSTPAVFTVSLTVPTTSTVTVKYVTSDGTATSGADYAVTAGALTFAPGERSKTVTVPVMGDRLDEADETFSLALVEPQNGTLADGAGAGVIVDDEAPRVAPLRVSSRTTPARDRSLPYRFRTTGRVMLPSGVRRSDACAGKVQVRFKAGSKTISTRRVNLSRDCTFSRRVSFGIKSRLRPGRLKVEVRFLGNAVLLPKSAPRRYVRVLK